MVRQQHDPACLPTKVESLQEIIFRGKKKNYQKKQRDFFVRRGVANDSLKKKKKTLDFALFLQVLHNWKNDSTVPMQVLREELPDVLTDVFVY